jgi:hypothetical protein
MNGGELTEVHFAIVTDNKDPEKRGRLKVRSQSLLGADVELPGWVEPESPLFTSIGGGGSLFLPKIQSVVELVVCVHDVGMDQMEGERFLQNPSGKWRHATPSGAADKMPLPVALGINYPNRRGWVTPAGHKIIMDDVGSIIIESKDGHTIEMKDGEIHISPNGKTVLKSPTLIGEGATELLVLGNALMTMFNSHTHPTGVGPSGPPTPPGMTTAQLSSEGNKVK